jgi:hypothetical protein
MDLVKKSTPDTDCAGVIVLKDILFLLLLHNFNAPVPGFALFGIIGSYGRQ